MMVLAMVAPTWVHCGHCGGAQPKENHRQCQAELGEPAPEFALYGIDGKTYRLSDYQGKIVVLEWTNHECPVVNRCHEAKLISRARAMFKDKPVVWLAINSSHFAGDRVEEIKEWVAKNDVSYPILLDSEGEVGHAYGAKTTPHMFVIDTKGYLVYKGALDSNPNGAKKDGVRPYIEQAVTALLNGTNIPRTHTKPYGCSVKYKAS